MKLVFYLLNNPNAVDIGNDVYCRGYYIYYLEFNLSCLLLPILVTHPFGNT